MEPKKLFEELGSGLGIETMLNWADSPRVVRLEELGPVVHDQVARDARAEVAADLKAIQDAYQAEREKAALGHERKLYERLRKKFEG